jgi:hypothetical protein
MVIIIKIIKIKDDDDDDDNNNNNNNKLPCPKVLTPMQLNIL